MDDVPIEREFWNSLRRQIAKRAGAADSEDLLHSAYLRFIRYRAQHAVENTASFIVRSAINIGIDARRRDELLDKVVAQDLPWGEKAPLQDEVLATRARLERVKSGLELLSPRTREVFLMHRLENLKYREIARQLGISQSAVEKHVAKAALFLTEWTEGW
jgi:RNA polymerase sigma-70 factor (ECF subfamily)